MFKKRCLYLAVAFHFICFNARSQTFHWECLPQPVANDFIYNLDTFNEKLLITGGFYSSGQNFYNAILEWQDSSFSTMAGGLRRKDQYHAQAGQTLVFNNELYVIGDFDSAGTIATKGLAKWDGQEWKSMIGKLKGGLQCLTVYKNEIYIGGFFDSIDGLAIKNLARWDGIQWQKVGKGINGNSVNYLHTYNNELYVLGSIDSVDGIVANNIVRWDGSNWKKVSDKILEGSCMVEWNNLLLIGSQMRVDNNLVYKQVMQWDGSVCNLFCEQVMFDISELKVINGNLYCAGGHVGLFNTNTKQWDFISQELSTSKQNSVNTICEYKGDLYGAGSFSINKGSKCDYIAKMNKNSSVNNLINSPDDYVSIYSNDNKIVVNSNLEEFYLEIYDLAGRVLYSGKICNNHTFFDSFGTCGLYVWKAEYSKNNVKAVRSGKFQSN